MLSIKNKYRLPGRISDRVKVHVSSLRSQRYLLGAIRYGLTFFTFLYSVWFDNFVKQTVITSAKVETIGFCCFVYLVRWIIITVLHMKSPVFNDCLVRNCDGIRTKLLFENHSVGLNADIFFTNNFQKELCELCTFDVYPFHTKAISNFLLSSFPLPSLFVVKFN